MRQGQHGISRAYEMGNEIENIGHSPISSFYFLILFLSSLALFLRSFSFFILLPSIFTMDISSTVFFRGDASRNSERFSTVSELCEGLPEPFIECWITDFELVRLMIITVQDMLNDNMNGNQYIVLFSLNSRYIDDLCQHISYPDVDYRLQWEGSIGIMKLIPAFCRNLTANTAAMIETHLAAMGNSGASGSWESNVTYKASVGKGRQADMAFIPHSHLTAPGQSPGIPTLVIETGVADSFSRLRYDMEWWFSKLEGVQMDLIITIGPPNVIFELWINIPQSALEGYEAFADYSDLPFARQVVLVTPDEVLGAPMMIPFPLLYDQELSPTGYWPQDVILEAGVFRGLVENMF